MIMAMTFVIMMIMAMIIMMMITAMNFVMMMIMARIFVMTMIMNFRAHFGKIQVTKASLYINAQQGYLTLPGIDVDEDCGIIRSEIRQS